MNVIWCLIRNINKWGGRHLFLVMVHTIYTFWSVTCVWFQYGYICCCIIVLLLLLLLLLFFVIVVISVVIIIIVIVLFLLLLLFFLLHLYVISCLSSLAPLVMFSNECPSIIIRNEIICFYLLQYTIPSYFPFSLFSFLLLLFLLLLPPS